jgi:hypothetical protein
VGLNFLTKAVNSLINPLEPEVNRSLDYYMDLVLRHFANESFMFAVFAGYIPGLMLISLMVAFYLYLQQRSRSIALGALVFGTLLGALWIARRMFGSVMSAMAAQYTESAPPTIKQGVLTQAKPLYYYDSLGRMLSERTSLLAYAMFGFLFMKGKGLEFFTGIFFLGSSVILLINQFTTSLYFPFEKVDVLILPAIAYLLCGVLLWKYKTEAENWPGEPKLWVR